MTREDHLKFCKICNHRKLEPKLGLVCSITNSIADFQGTCPNFELDQEEELKYFNRKVADAGDFGGKEFPEIAQGSNYTWNITLGTMLFGIGLIGFRLRFDSELVYFFKFWSLVILAYGSAIAKRGFAQRNLIKSRKGRD